MPKFKVKPTVQGFWDTLFHEEFVWARRDQACSQSIEAAQVGFKVSSVVLNNGYHAMLCYSLSAAFRPYLHMFSVCAAILYTWSTFIM